MANTTVYAIGQHVANTGQHVFSTPVHAIGQHVANTARFGQIKKMTAIIMTVFVQSRQIYAALERCKLWMITSN